jgi:hypothetical protein
MMLLKNLASLNAHRFLIPVNPFTSLDPWGLHILRGLRRMAAASSFFFSDSLDGVFSLYEN